MLCDIATSFYNLFVYISSFNLYVNALMVQCDVMQMYFWMHYITIGFIWKQTDSVVVLICLSGSKYWVFKDTRVLPGYPRHLSEWGMRTRDGRVVEQVEAAFVWAHNGHTYLFSGEEFWRFTENEAQTVPHPDADYPRSASLWKGVPSVPDDIISWGKGN